MREGFFAKARAGTLSLGYRLHFPAVFRETDYSAYGVPDKYVVLAAGQCAQISCSAPR
jgi:hypothetical protein